MPDWMRLRFFALLICLGTCATPVSAQTPGVPSVEAGRPFSVSFDHDGLNVTHFRVLLNGKQVVEVPASARVNGVVTVDMAPLTIGAYLIVAVARNAPTSPFTDPIEASSVPYAFEVRQKAPAPNPPTWRATVLLIAGQAPILESLVALEEVPETLRLLPDGTARVVR
jgi:hypothetical protein